MITTKLEAVYNILKENIVTGNLKPGERLVIRKTAQELGVSEIPVREAIRLLEAQGFVTMTPHAGAHVSMLDEENIREIIELRSIIEGYAAKSAIPLSKTEAKELAACIDKMRGCCIKGDYAQFGFFNAKFHAIMYERVGNKRMKKIIFSLQSECERTRAVFSLSPTRAEQSIKEHEEILAVLLAGDKEKVEFLARRHRQRAGKALLEQKKFMDNAK
ncbi:MAG: GntR family transcriptional regulator [Acidaminococcales bacterium]|jgi:DNA-binding GntR family transcriptional regulator|nr:GntR family transcriptional regulator [Acidaminococcales bacterium]